ncbi:probable RNA-directed DNA polymerase from transposon BS [Trichonephila clavipes]|nr:probable RNA-directed DNA polymerase from transposon BS [Trichonephila clavipes]
MTNRSCNFSPFMNSTPSITNAASVVAQSKKDHVPGLGTGPEAVDNGIKSIHLTDSVDLNWCSLKEMILKAAKRNIFKSRDFRLNEFEAAIGDSSLNKSPGPNGIHGQMIDHLGLRGRLRFLDIINCSWNKGQPPRNWRRVTVIPIMKCGKTDGTPESFRPIALTNIACTIMKKRVLRRLTFHLHFHNLLQDEQYGFREGHFTTDQLLYFCHRIRDAHYRKRTNHTVAVFLDFSKAFDRVWNNLLLSNCLKILVLEEKPYPGLTIS